VNRRTAVLLGVAMLVVPVVATRAQTTQGEIVGTVRDPQGAAVPGVTVTVTNTGTGLTRTGTTADTGSFRFPALPTVSMTSRRRSRASPSSL
jgi:Carboxypeptidase regulatory-like domain